MEGVAILIGLVIFYWITTIVLFLAGLIMLRSRPEKAKKLLTFSGILFLIGGGICGLLLS